MTVPRDDCFFQNFNLEGCDFSMRAILSSPLYSVKAGEPKHNPNVVVVCGWVHHLKIDGNIIFDVSKNESIKQTDPLWWRNSSNYSMNHHEFKKHICHMCHDVPCSHRFFTWINQWLLWYEVIDMVIRHATSLPKNRASEAVLPHCVPAAQILPYLHWLVVWALPLGKIMEFVNGTDDIP